MPDYADLPQGPKEYVPIEEIPGNGLAPDEILMEMEDMMEDARQESVAMQAIRDDLGLVDDVHGEQAEELLAESTEPKSMAEPDVVERAEVLAAESKADGLLDKEGLEKRKRSWHPGKRETHKVHGREHTDKPAGPKLSDFEQEA